MRSEPTIEKCKGKPYTKVSFRPDYKRLGLEGLSPDMMGLLVKRVYDIGAVTDQTTKKIKVMYNNEQVPVKNFSNYLDLYIGTKDTQKRVHESPH